MAVPAYAAAGTGSTATTGTLTPAYPAGISAGDLLVLHVSGQQSGSGAAAVTQPSGWTTVVDDETTNATYYGAVFTKVADGTESGTLSVSKANESVVSQARIYRFTGAGAATDTEGVASGLHGSGTTINMLSVTTTAADRLCLHLTFIRDSTANQGAPVQVSATGETGGNWTEAVAEYTSTTGPDESLGLQTAGKASAGTISGGSFNTNHSVNGFKVAFAIFPASATTYFGATSLAITESVTTVAKIGAFSSSSSVLSSVRAVAGFKETFSSLSSALTFNALTAGARAQFGAANMVVQFVSSESGTRTTFGIVAVPTSFTALSSGFKETFGSSSLPVVFTVTTAGSNAALIYGSTSLSIANAFTTSGFVTAFSRLSAGVNVQIAASGKLIVFASSGSVYVFLPDVNGTTPILYPVITPVPQVEASALWYHSAKSPGKPARSIRPSSRF